MSSPRGAAPEPALGEEKPRDVFLAACAQLAHRFEAHGEMELSPWQPIMEAEGLAYTSLAYELDY